MPPKPIIDRADALLIRPDAHIAWAATIDEPADTAALALRGALSCWFDTPLNTSAVGRRRRQDLVTAVFGIEVAVVEKAVLSYHVVQGGDPVLVVLPPAAGVGGSLLP